ncbi:hypothetical protein CS022_01115 [Veronia nyctiphanis]|uniref:Porin n=1 Tax=Veronia nyctiphanis TaxID=1278244 RepID=A0A4Q0YVE6_9GAMM|nr:hypothetical protein [Veronia nyctiphanis]RXJ74843.1 hypothetical protein CS022_01115 [Veronia nyctiphanis]
MTESLNVVDVINQSDLVDSITGQKLGQPMINLNLENDFGLTEFYVMPLFRERTFASNTGRLSFPGIVNNPIYESSRKQQHIDLALRYSYSFDTWDLGFTVFHGTNREPYFAAEVSTPVETQINTVIDVVPYYAQMTQFGIDLQAFWGDWTWKLEAIRRESLVSHTAIVAGFEYPFVGVWGSDSEVTLFAEYLYDSRDPIGPVRISLDDTTQLLIFLSDTLFGGVLTPDFQAEADARKLSPTITQNDIFSGIRWAFNDINGTELRLGFLMDIEHISSYSTQIEVTSRFSESLTWRVSGAFFNSEEKQDPLFNIKDDDYVEAGVKYYF